jgi:hypothetical protein
MNLSPVQRVAPIATEIARKVEKEVQKQAIDTIMQIADQWVSENKLMHAGAAQRLAEKLKKSFQD